MAYRKKKGDEKEMKPADKHRVPIPVSEDGLPAAKYDEYGNPVNASGNKRGLWLRENYQTANKNIAAPTPEQVVAGLTRPYWTINQMPIEYVYNAVVGYLESCLEPVYERLPVLDDNGNPTFTVDGTPIMQTTITNYVYKNVPTRYGIAQALGVDLRALETYLKVDVFNDDDHRIPSSHVLSSGREQTAKVSRDNSLINLDDVTTDSVLYKIYGDNIYYDTYLREELKKKTEKDIKLFIIQRARTEIMKYHEQRLGLNENVTGSLFALLNSKDGWTNEHKVSIEVPNLMGEIKSVEELDKMTDYEEDNIIDITDNEKDFTVIGNNGTEKDKGDSGIVISSKNTENENVKYIVSNDSTRGKKEGSAEKDNEACSAKKTILAKDFNFDEDDE